MVLTRQANQAKRFQTNIDQNVVTIGSTLNADLLVDAGHTFATQLQAAIDYLADPDVGGGVVSIYPGSFTLNARIVPKNNVTIKGSGIDDTIITGTVISDWAFLNPTGTLTNFAIKDLTLDLNNVSSGSGVQLRKSTRCTLERVRFVNGASGGWMAIFGTDDGAVDNTLYRGNRVIDCEFDTHSGTLEMLLLFNQKDAKIVRPRFINKAAGGRALGLWQKCYNTVIQDPIFVNNAGACMYYSITVENTYINNLYAENSGTAIEGANISDNGAFGLTRAKNLFITNPIIFGGENSLTSTGIQLGAVDGAKVINPYIEEYQIGINFTNGNNAATTAAINWEIINPQIKNCNPENAVWALHPGILFSQVGGTMNGRIVMGDIYDDQGTKTQRYPIVFTGAFTWSGIQIYGTRLSADSGAGGTSIRLDSSAAVDATVRIINAQDITLGSIADSAYVDFDTTYLLDGVLSLGTLTPGAGNALRIDAGGTTRYMQFGDSFKIRGVSGHTEVLPLFAAKKFRVLSSGSVVNFAIDEDSGTVEQAYTDASGTPGAATINKPRGKVAIALGATTVVVTNSLVTANSHISLTLEGAFDTTLTKVTATPGAGSFTITGDAAATAAVKVSFHITN